MKNHLISALLTVVLLTGLGAVLNSTSANSQAAVWPDAAGGHSCWTSGNHPYPTHVVATKRGHDHAEYYGRFVTERALNALFTPGDSLRAERLKSVTAFCK